MRAESPADPRQEDREDHFDTQCRCGYTREDAEDQHQASHDLKPRDERAEDSRCNDAHVTEHTRDHVHIADLHPAMGEKDRANGNTNE